MGRMSRMKMKIERERYESSLGPGLRVWLLCTLLLAGCRPAPSPAALSAGADGSFPRTVKIPGEAEILIPRRPQRIISLTPSHDEILCALVDERRIAGLSRFSQDETTSYAAEAGRRINVFVDRNAEQIVSLRPDLVVAGRYAKVDLKSLLAQLNQPIIVTTSFRTLSEIEANIRLIAQAVGEERRAETVIGEMRQKLAAARTRLRPELAGRRVLYLGVGKFAAGAETSFHEVLTAAGMKNAAAESGLTGYVKVAAEQLLQIDPEVIVVATGYERNRGFRQQLEADPQLAAVKAIKNRHVIELPARDALSVSHHIADAVAALVDAINQSFILNREIR
ncbi:MAG TPA: ABC transporter substrate-binding protein [Blastocatellia bacterium]|nr:ABC transporter substrate-binding protein [Blastocatellia bacterium]